MGTICNEEEGTEYEVVTIGMGDEVTDIRLENREEIEKDGDGMKAIGQVNDDNNRTEVKLKRSRTELKSIHRYKQKHPLLPPCGDKCKKNCQSNRNEAQRLIIHQQYSNKNYDERKSWIRPRKTTKTS